jgi:phospho-N-acetylmuramoyl-pentapeptide-transferase
MSYALAIGTVAFFVSVLIGKPAIRALRAGKIGKAISEDAPSSHMAKAGTPTMGGLIFLSAVLLVTIVFNLRERLSILLPLGVLAVTMAIGLWDDRGTLLGRLGQRGLTWRLKFGLLALLAAGEAAVLYLWLDTSSINVPWLGQFDIGPLYLLVALVTVFATTSAVSITDGLDGLLGGTAAVAFAAYGIIAFAQGQDFLATFSFTMVGALLGFLWYNAHPAQVFMGDTGALPLGALLATVALMTGWWLLLPLIGLVFVAEALSDVIQIAYFQTTGGRRIFRKTPLHHHLELIGWSEPQVVTRLWIVGIASGLLGVALALAV